MRMDSSLKASVIPPQTKPGEKKTKNMYGTVAQKVNNKTFSGKIIGQNFSIKVFF